MTTQVFQGIPVSFETHETNDDVPAFRANIDTRMLKGQRRRINIAGIDRLGEGIRGSRRYSRRLIN